MVTKDIYAFYTELGNPQEPPLIEYWKSQWSKEGWTPHILTEADARKDPRYEAMLTRGHELPWPPHHELFGPANMRRWLAFAHVDGAVADYDVFPIRPFPPQEFDGFTCYDACGGPGFIVGSHEDFTWIRDHLIAYQIKPTDVYLGRVCVSEMIMVRAAKDRYRHLSHQVQCYGTARWKEFPLIHFGNSYMRPYREASRMDQIRTIIDDIYPEQKKLCPSSPKTGSAPISPTGNAGSRT